MVEGRKHGSQVLNLTKPKPLRTEIVELGGVISFGANNTFPQDISLRARRSPTYRAVLRKKNTYINGSGLAVDDSATENYIAMVNEKESLWEVMRKAIEDYSNGGNYYLEIVKPTAESDTAFIFRRDWTQCRVNSKDTGVFIARDWKHINDGQDDRLALIPKYPNFGRAKIGAQLDKLIKDEVSFGVRSILHVKNEEPEFHFYGLPDGLAAYVSGWHDIDYNIGRFNMSRFDNKFICSGILFIPADYTEEEAEQAQQMIDEDYTGEDNNSRVLMMYGTAEGGGRAEFVPLNDVDKGTFLDLHTEAEKFIIKSEGFPPVLAGISEPGRLGNNQDRQIIYDEYINTEVQEMQEDILKPVRRVLDDLGFSADDLRFINKMPWSMLSTEQFLEIFKEDQQVTEILKEQFLRRLADPSTKTNNG